MTLIRKLCFYYLSLCCWCWALSYLWNITATPMLHHRVTWHWQHDNIAVQIVMRGRFKVMLILLTFVNETKIDCVLCKVCKGLNIFFNEDFDRRQSKKIDIWPVYIRSHKTTTIIINIISRRSILSSMAYKIHNHYMTYDYYLVSLKLKSVLQKWLPQAPTIPYTTYIVP